MPTHVITRPAVTTPAASQRISVNPLAVVAAILLTALHVVAAAMLERTRDNPVPGAIVETIDEEVSCTAKAGVRAPALPFD